MELYFRWLYGVGKFTSIKCLFERHNTMSMKYLLYYHLMCFYNSLVSSNNCVIYKFFLHSFCDKKIMVVFQHYNVDKFSNVTSIKKNVLAKLIEYCEDQEL